jgi:glycosyltransferase involved in cell wall biosynthesis
MKTVAVIPTLNEEKHIAEVLSKTRKYVDRIIVVDSSSDRTPEIISSGFRDTILVREGARGKGIQVRRGISRALELMPEYVLMMDGDGERDPADIPHLIEALQRKKVHLVVGRRDIMRSYKRKLLNKFGMLWINLLTGYGLADPFSGFIAFRREALQKIRLNSRGFEIEPEIMLESWKSGFRISEAGITVPSLSESKFRKRDMLSVNLFFDSWILRNLPNIPKTKLPFLFVSCLFGFLFSKSILSISRL